MIEILKGFPAGVVAAVTKGRVTKSDYDNVLVPAIEEAFRRREKLRCYYELGREFLEWIPARSGKTSGLASGISRAGDGFVVVTDVDWVRLAINAFRFLVPGDFRLPMTTQNISLNGKWEVVFDPSDSGKARKYFKSFPAGAPIQVPGVWEQVKPGYDGVGWYHRTVAVRPEWKDKVLRLRFGAVNYFAEVWLNGILLGSHEGGYTPFVLDISAAARVGENDLVVRVIDPPRNRRVQGFMSSAPLLQSDIPCWKSGWYYTFGGSGRGSNSW